MNRIPTATFALAATLAAGALTPAFAQAQFVQARQAPAAPTAQVPVPAPNQQQVVVYQNTASARDVQEELRNVLERYPPSVRQLIQLDPTLMTRADFMTTYPQLQSFLQQHPEVVRNPAFYFGSPYSNDYERNLTDRQRTLRVVEEMLTGLAILTGFLTVVSFIYSLLRQTLEHRRWRRQIQIQTDVHTKLLDRMTNNQELLAYIETSAGRRFLETPVSVAAHSPALSTPAPVARILWSVQIGVVVVAAGIGFWLARANVSDVDLASVFQVMGSLAVSVGVGFVVSAILSWALSQRMGLIAIPAPKVE